jgi:4-hydroxyphenylpyruvate dioxygenase-like putative hemolysin
MDGTDHLQTRDFVLHMQLATLQLFEFEIIDRRMRPGFGNFGFKCPVLPLQFRKVRF